MPQQSQHGKGKTKNPNRKAAHKYKQARLMSIRQSPKVRTRKVQARKDRNVLLSSKGKWETAEALEKHRLGIEAKKPKRPEKKRMMK